MSDDQQRQDDEKKNDGASLLPVDASSTVTSEPLPNICRCGQRDRQPRLTNQIICAAIRFADGRIVRGHRHDACFKYASGWTPAVDWDGHVQGFIDARNQFVDRKEAMRIQIAAGIPSHDGGRMEDGLVLFSEDVY